jgi:hypothetical protein
MAKFQSKYDWETIRQEYVVGYFVTDPETFQKRHIYPTYNDIAAKYGMNYEYLKKKGQRESWVTRREALQAKLREKTASNTLHSFISDSAQFDAMTLVALKKLYKLVDAYFDQYDFLEVNPDGTYGIRGYSENEDEENNERPHIKINDLRGLVETLDKAQALVRRTVGEPLTNAQGENSMVASEIFNPYVQIENTKNREDAKSRVDSLIEKRSNQSKTIEQLQEGIKELHEEMKIMSVSE